MKRKGWSIHHPPPTSHAVLEKCSGHDGKRGAAPALEVLILQLLNGGQVVSHARLIVEVLARELLVGGDVGFVGHREGPVGNESLYALALRPTSLNGVGGMETAYSRPFPAKLCGFYREFCRFTSLIQGFP